MIGMDIRGDIADARKGLDNLGVEMKAMTRSLLSALANEGKKWIRKRMKNYLNFSKGSAKAEMGLHRQTGQLLRGLKTTVKGNYATIAGNPARIGEILERGGTITAKKKGYLTFEGSDGSWKRMHSVTIPAKHWFSRSADGFEGSAEAAKAIDKGIARALKRAWA